MPGKTPHAVVIPTLNKASQIGDRVLGVIYAGMSAAAVFFKYAFVWERQKRG